MSFRRIMSVMRKEWWHITRDATSFVLLLLSPVLVLVTMGYAFSVDIEDVTVAVLDQDRSPTSREYISQISSTDALLFDEWPTDMEEVEAPAPNQAGKPPERRASNSRSPVIGWSANSRSMASSPCSTTPVKMHISR